MVAIVSVIGAIMRLMPVSIQPDVDDFDFDEDSAGEVEARRTGGGPSRSTGGATAGSTTTGTTRSAAGTAAGVAGSERYAHRASCAPRSARATSNDGLVLFDRGVDPGSPDGAV